MLKIEKAEVIKEFEYTVEDLTHKIKAKILKRDENHYGVILSHWYKKYGDHDYTQPGWGVDSLEKAEDELNRYMKDFTLDLIVNPKY
ncbi:MULTISPECIES: hypothetical protein [Porphyromonadaceae]|uniref:Uncharacterized protein n=1 Tax=Sanguibacteroides justesenii TaxID=1547597 RepID=A0A0C3RIH8_9PORP|nr:MULTISPECIES: hypothetical protein [Porphyromonadaceae]KIO43610.1 hypothetical protein IE90_10845 [Sanguibacteroides justesenii]KIO45774.1 hypothetical protein BA92_04785 [Sanguibacteroides justesenii]PXZ45138.1 hypothetical protein DMB45_01505 [Sanguibacteroides justesenii]